MGGRDKPGHDAFLRPVTVINVDRKIARDARRLARDPIGAVDKDRLACAGTRRENLIRVARHSCARRLRHGGRQPPFFIIVSHAGLVFADLAAKAERNSGYTYGQDLVMDRSGDPAPAGDGIAVDRNAAG